MKNVNVLFITAAGAILPLLFSGIVAAEPPAFGLEPFTFDPGEDCFGIEATWDFLIGAPEPSIRLTKPCPTSTVAASGVDIVTALEGQEVSNLIELNFDVKADEHCGAGAPRFNLELIDTDNNEPYTVFLGCAAGIKPVEFPESPIPGWLHVEYTQAEIAAAVLAAEGGSLDDILTDLYIIFDEGNDTPPSAGLVHIDNISVNGLVVGDPTSPLNQNACKKGGWQNLIRADGSDFKNQGDCIQYAKSGK